MSSETLVPAGEVEAREHVKANANPEGLIVREYAAELNPGEGRTVDVRIVPFGERIEHNDGLGGVRRGVMYQEEWMPGAFAHQMNAAFRVHANVEHEQGINGKVGHGAALREVPDDGYHGSFVMLETQAGETALQLIRAGALDGVSLEAEPVKSVRRDGVVQRVKANLRAVSFTRFGAYQGAKVLAVREEAQMVDEQLAPVDLDPELIERCRRLGLKLPQRYEAHPDEPGTPAAPGTPESGTRPQTENIPTVED